MKFIRVQRVSCKDCAQPHSTLDGVEVYFCYDIQDDGSEVFIPSCRDCIIKLAESGDYIVGTHNTEAINSMLETLEIPRY